MDPQGQPEPLVYIPVLDEEAIAEFLGRNVLLKSSSLRRRTVLVGAAYVEGLVAAQSAVTCKAVGREGRPRRSQTVRLEFEDPLSVPGRWERTVILTR